MWRAFYLCGRLGAATPILANKPDRLLAETRTYHEFRRLEKIAYSRATGAATCTDTDWKRPSYDYTRNLVGNPTDTVFTGRSATTTEANTVNSYDTLHRITVADYATGNDEAFNYDLLGNRESGIQDRDGATWDYQNNLVNEYWEIDENGTNPPAAVPLVHDAAGNLTKNAAGYAFDYDEENRVTEVRAPDATVLAQFRYDALGRRVEQIVDLGPYDMSLRYYQETPAGPFAVDAETGGDRSNVLAVYRQVGAGSVYFSHYFVNGSAYIDERVVMHLHWSTNPALDRFYLYRDLWTVAGIVRASGYVTEEYTYSVYGVPTLYYYPPGDGVGGPNNEPPDGVIDIHDRNKAAADCLGDPTPCGCEWADLEFDGDVDLDDLAEFDDIIEEEEGNICSGSWPCPITTSTEQNPYFFTGRRLDFLDPAAPTPLLVYDYRARTYDPVHGRFHQRDPSGYEDTYNLLQYVQSRPGVFTDPSGWLTVAGTGTAATGGAMIWAAGARAAGGALGYVARVAGRALGHAYVQTATAILAAAGTARGGLDIGVYSALVNELARFTEWFSSEKPQGWTSDHGDSARRAFEQYFGQVGTGPAGSPGPGGWRDMAARAWHAINRHASQFFGVPGWEDLTAAQIREWSTIIQYVAKSRRIVEGEIGGIKTYVHVVKVQGKWVMAHFDRVTNELVSVVVGTQKQLRWGLK